MAKAYRVNVLLNPEQLQACYKLVRSVRDNEPSGSQLLRDTRPLVVALERAVNRLSADRKQLIARVGDVIDGQPATDEQLQQLAREQPATFAYSNGQLFRLSDNNQQVKRG